MADKKLKRHSKNNDGTLSNEERMRILANLMIDKILVDYRNNSLKFGTERTILKSP